MRVAKSRRLTHALSVIALTVAGSASAVTLQPAQAEPLTGSSTPALVPVAATGIPGQLNAVAATSPSDAWAVGYHWSGGTSTQPATLILHWNGTGWSRVPSPSPVTGDELSGVSATSPANAWAVGGAQGVPLILHWNGTKWSTVTSPTAGTWPTTLVGVSATSASNAWAVGLWFDNGIDKTFIVHWNGTKWSRVKSPNPGGVDNYDLLDAVAATSASNAWAVGSCGACTSPTFRWNGTGWSNTTGPHYPALTGVSGTSPSNAWATGQWYNQANQTQATLLLRWNGTTWSKVASPNGPSAQYNELTAVSALSTSDAWAVGAYGVTGDCTDFSDCRTLTLFWNGTSWSRVVSPNPPSSNSQLYGVTVTSGGNAWAVGGYCNTTTCATLALSWNGTSWQLT